MQRNRCAQIGRTALSFVLSVVLSTSGLMPAVSALAEEIGEPETTESLVEVADESEDVDESDAGQDETAIETKDSEENSDEVVAEDSSAETIDSAVTDSESSTDTSSLPDEFIGTSWRYLNGVPRSSLTSTLSSSSLISWSKDGSDYVGSNGVRVQGATGFGIDVSEHQGTIDWAKVKAAGVDFAILRCGWGRGGVDKTFTQNLQGCIENDIPFGVYVYSYEWDYDSAKRSAQYVVSLLKENGVDPADLALPVFYDLENEDKSTGKPAGIDDNNQLRYIEGASTFANIAKGFTEVLEANGYEVGIYANRNWFTNYLTDSYFDTLPRWVADYTGTGSSKYTGEYSWWQCMSTGTVNGISGAVDINFEYECGLSVAISADTIYCGDSVTVTPTVTGIPGNNYQFNYVWERNNWAIWSSTYRESESYTTDSEWTFTPDESGIYQVGVDIVLSNGRKISSLKTVVVKDNWQIEDFKADDGFVGQSVEMTVSVTGPDAGDVSYNFGWCYEGEFEYWSSYVRENGSYTKDVSWSFTPQQAGSYVLFVDVVGSDGFKTTKQIKISVSDGWSFDALLVDASSVELGDTLTVAPEISGANAKHVKYNYVWAYEGKFNDWGSTLKETGEYTSDPSWEFTPTKAGSYVLYVDATYGSVTITKSIPVDVTSEWSVSELTLTVGGQEISGEIGFGNDVLLTVDFEEGSNTKGLSYNYIWRYGDGWDEWDSLKNHGELASEPSHSFSLSKAGSYTLYVDVIGSDGKTQTFSCELDVVLPYSISGITLSNTSLIIGESTVVTPNLTGDCTGLRFNYGYAYEGKFEDWGSSVKDGGQPVTDRSWTFAPEKTGTYVVFVDVYGIDGSKQTYRSTVTVDRAWSTSTLTTTKTSYKVGENIDFTFTVTGERKGRVEYNFVWQRDGWKDWSSSVKSGQGYLDNVSSLSFSPSHSGRYVFYIDCRDVDTGDVVTVSSATVQVNKTWSLDSLSLNYSWPVHPGEGVSGTAVVSGDTDGLKYNFVWQRDGWADWNSNIRAGGYSSRNTMNWSPISMSGTYSFYVDVVDENGEIETASVTGIKVMSSASIITSIINKLGGERVNKSVYGYKYENAILSAGGQLCAGIHGKWCAAYLWWGFDQTGYRGLWGTSGLHVQSDPEYLAQEYKSVGRYYSGTAGIKRGDLLFMKHTPWRVGQTITHVAIVTKVTSSSITVIEGNMGWGPYHTYDRYLSKFIGYARPSY